MPWAAAGVGGIATQALANVRYGPDGLAALAAGRAAERSSRPWSSADPGAAERQLGVVDVRGDGATYTGDGLPAVGRRPDRDRATRRRATSWPGAQRRRRLLAAYVRVGHGRLPDRLLAALLAADRAGGDRRGRQSAALLVVRDGRRLQRGRRPLDRPARRRPCRPGPRAHPARAPCGGLLMERPEPEDLIAIDAAARRGAARRGSPRLGWGPDAVDADAAFQARMRAELGAVPRIGEARPAMDGWEPDWDAALLGWIGVANLEARTAAPGWIDPAVLAAVREASDPG